MENQLRQRIAELEAQLAQSKPAREKIVQMSSEVVDANPYSRLMALKRMGIVQNYEVSPSESFFEGFIPNLGFFSAAFLVGYSKIHRSNRRRWWRRKCDRRDAHSLRNRQTNSLRLRQGRNGQHESSLLPAKSVRSE